MPIVTEGLDGFYKLLNTYEFVKEFFKSFETRSFVVVSKFNTFSKTTKLSQCLAAIMSLGKANIDLSQQD